MSAFATYAGLPVVEAVVALPRVGVWHADITVDTDAPPAGKRQTLALGDYQLKCGAYRSGMVATTFKVRAVGGSGQIHTARTPARSYRSASVRQVVTDILRASSDSLSPTSTLQASTLPSWSTREEPAGLSLAKVLDGALVPAWRFLADGTLWCGSESWPAAKLTEYEVLAEYPEQDKLCIRTLDFSLQPGTVLDGRRISYVLHRITDDAFETEVWVE